jgi:RPA family protein
MTAVRASVSDIINGTYGEDNGPHVISPFGVELRRVVLVGFVVSKFNKDASSEGKRFVSITLDDGTDTIRLKVWGDEDAALLDGIKEQILALVIGKVRKYEEETYIVPEIIKEVEDPNYMGLHLLERYQAILTRSGVTMPEVIEDGQQQLSTSSPKVTSVKGITKQILSYIELHANPQGVHMKDIVAFFEEKGEDSLGIQTKVFNLIADGLITEVDPSRYLPAD